MRLTAARLPARRRLFRSNAMARGLHNGLLCPARAGSAAMRIPRAVSVPGFSWRFADGPWTGA